MMRSEVTKKLQALMHEVLKPLGLVRVGSTWYFDSPEVIGVVNLQRSMWGASYYINLGVLVKALSTLHRPKEYQCHLRGRIENFMKVPGFTGELRFDNQAAEVALPEAAVVTAMTRPLVPLLKSLSRVDDIKAFVIAAPSNKVMANRELLDFLKLGDGASIDDTPL
jgi:hypothetical protein